MIGTKRHTMTRVNILYRFFIRFFFVFNELYGNCLSPRSILSQIRLRFLFVFWNLVDIIFWKLSSVHSLNSSRIRVPFVSYKVKPSLFASPHMSWIFSPAANIEWTHTFSGQFHNTFLLNGIEECFGIGILVGC